MAGRATWAWIAGLAVGSAALALAAALLVPPGLPYDEPAHWSNVLFYAENLRPPVLGDAGVTYQGQQTPLFYALAGVLVRIVGAPDAALLAVRLLSVVGAATLTVAIGAILVRVVPRRPVVVVLGTAFIAINPMFAVISGSVQNDTWSLVWTFALVWAALPLVDPSHRIRRPWAWGLLLGALGSAAILTKLSTASAVAAVLVVLLVRRRVAIAFTAVGVLLAACGWWIVRNYLLYGDLTGQAGVERAGYEFGQGALSPAHLARSALTYLFLPTEYLRNSIEAPWWIDGIVVLLGLAVLAGGFALALRVRRGSARGAVALLVAVGAVSVAAWIVQVTFGWHVAFRTAYGVLPLVALAFGSASAVVPSRRAGTAIAVGLGILLLVVAGWSLASASGEPAQLVP